MLIRDRVLCAQPQAVLFRVALLFVLVGCAGRGTPVPHRVTEAAATVSAAAPAPSAASRATAALPSGDESTAAIAAAAFPSWDFTIGESLGWFPTNHLSIFRFDAEGLHSRSTGGDPYMVGPHTEIDASAAWYVEVHMRIAAGTDAQLFWITRADSRYDEGKSQHFPVQGDGSWHTYRIPLHDNPAWRGTITQLRLDPLAAADVEITIARIGVLGAQPGVLAVKTFGSAMAVATAGQPFAVHARFRNGGDVDLGASTLRLVLPQGLALLSGSAEAIVPALAGGAEERVLWHVRGDAGVYALALMGDSGELAQAQAVVADPAGPAEVLANEHLQITFPSQPYGYGVATLLARDGETWRSLGRLNALASVAYRAGDGVEHALLAYADSAEPMPGGLRLAWSLTDRDGVHWRGESVLHLAPAEPWVTITATLETSAPVQLLHWMPLAFYAGDGAYGRDKSSALFPGLEYLLDGEESSGTDFFDPPYHERYLPHPNKITVPLMAVTQGGMSCGVMWDPLALWDGTHDRPGALFAAPNTWDGQENHLLALAVPGPLWHGENRMQGDEPYALPAGRTLTLAGSLFAIPADDAVAPLALWLHINGLPALPPLARSYPEAIRLSLASLTGPTWDEGAQGWHYALADPWGPQKRADSELHLWVAALRGDGTAQERAHYRELVRRLVAQSGTGLGPDLNLPPLWMHLADQDALLSTDRIAKNQNAPNREGYWPYDPGWGRDRPLGQEGDTSSGQIATNALYFLRIARITGDPELAEQGLRALAYLEAHHSRRPEGAQVWELQLHSPDLLAAAKAEQCYLEAYWLTGEAHYAERAQWWALNGLPFVYLWSAHDRPIMAYATVPVFAATRYTYPWPGRPVMWNGLDYALGLWPLNRVLEEAGIASLLDWRQVAEGITRATLQMQAESGPYLGMYPDAWDVVIGDEAYTWWLHPYYILQNLYVMEGAGVEVRTHILHDAPPVHVSAVAEIVGVQRREGTLEVELGYYAGETTVLMVSPWDAAPQQVLLDGQTLARIESLAEAPSGWLYRHGVLLVKIPFTADRVRITIEG